MSGSALRRPERPDEANPAPAALLSSLKKTQSSHEACSQYKTDRRYPNTVHALSFLTTRRRWHPRNCFSPTGGTTELYKQTFLCLTHLDGSIAAWGLSFTSTNRPLYRTQSLPKLLFILSQSESSCLSNRMDHLYCIATGNLSSEKQCWDTLLLCFLLTHLLPQVGLGIVWGFFDTGAKSILLKRYRCLNGAWTDTYI